MTDSQASEDGSSRRPLKVIRLIEEYDLGDIGTEVEQRWTATGSERMSLRDLAGEFDKRLLETEMEEVGMQPLGGKSRTPIGS